MTPLRVAQAINALGGGGSVIQSIQRGTSVIGYQGSMWGGATVLSSTVTISSVTTSKTMVNLLGWTGNPVRLALANATSIQGNRETIHANNAYASWEAIEFK